MTFDERVAGADVVLAIDQGTSATKAVVVTGHGVGRDVVLAPRRVVRVAGVRGAPLILDAVVELEAARAGALSRTLRR